MFTGLYPRTHGVRWNGDSLGAEHVTLAEVLTQAGYSTGAFVSYKAMVARGGLDQGFGVISDEQMPANPWRHETHVREGKDVNRLAFEFLDGQPDEGKRPTFMWLHYFEPHSPYPLTSYASERLGEYDGVLADGADVAEFYELNKLKQDEDGSARVIQHLYDGRVMDADLLVGELLEGLKARNLLEETIIIVVGDHGQLLGEHGAYGHGKLIWQELLQVPLIIVDPRESGRGLVASQRVGVIDLMPTVLDLLDIESPEAVQGRSLVSAIRGGPVGEAVYFSEVRIPDPRTVKDQISERVADPIAVFEGQFKLVFDSEPRALYDLNLDPQESSPVSSGNTAAIAERMRLRASQFQEAAAGAFSIPDDMDAEVLKELQALGYADGDEE